MRSKAGRSPQPHRAGEAGRGADIALPAEADRLQGPCVTSPKNRFVFSTVDLPDRSVPEIKLPLARSHNPDLRSVDYSPALS